MRNVLRSRLPAREGGAHGHRQRADAHDEAELGAEAFLDNDYVPGELDAPRRAARATCARRTTRPTSTPRARMRPRASRRERRSGDEEARESSGPETVVPEDVDMEALAGMAARAADDAAARMERLRREGLEGLGKDERGEGK